MAKNTSATTGTGGRGVARRMPLIGHMTSEGQFKAVGGAALACLVVSLFSAGGYTYSENKISAQETVSAQMTTISQKLAKNAGLASRGDKSSFALLETDKALFATSLAALQNGGDVSGKSVLGVSNAEALSGLSKVAASWGKAERLVQTVLASKSALINFQKHIQDINSIDRELLEQARFFQSVIMEKGDQRQQDMAGKISLLSQRIVKNANSLVAAEEIDLSSSFLLGKDTNTVKKYISALLVGSDALLIEKVGSKEGQAALADLSKTFEKLVPGISFVQKNQGDLIAARASFKDLAVESEALSGASESLVANLISASQGNLFFLGSAVLFFMFSVGFGILVLKIVSDQAVEAKKAVSAQKESSDQQASIVTLLDEISALADGDLTVKATVNESFTGAIADSINYTIAQLRKIIIHVVETTNKVDSSANETKAAAKKMFESSQDQFDRLAKTGKQIVSISAQMDELTQETSNVTSAAKQSVEVSQSGQLVVRQTIERMNIIRENIQETSKKIKLLGESSTAIGEVTGLIRDITKQINILALNAAIQAASAGESGRGFAVVAQEVQRLALSSADAAKRIDDLVLTIQDDAKGAVYAMEQSTREVVEGAKLTDKAGASLKEIGAVADEVASLVSKVTMKIEEQSEEATNVSLDMRLLQEYTEKTMANIEAATTSSEQVQIIVDELKGSVSGFKV